MNKQQFAALIEQTETFKSFPGFKKKLTLANKNIEDLMDLYGQAERLGLDYLRQNSRLQSSTVKLIDELLKLNK